MRVIAVKKKEVQRVLEDIKASGGNSSRWIAIKFIQSLLKNREINVFIWEQGKHVKL